MRIKNLLSLLLVVVPLLATAAPKSDLWPRWQQHNPTSTLQVDHETWTGFLQKYIAPHQPEGVHKVRFADEKLLQVEGEPISLNDIEHRILRPIWRDPRLHYAISCASLGCPNLEQVAFTPENTATLLDSGARAFVNHPRGVRFADDDELVLSTIYDWFDEDFGGNEAGVLAHIQQFANPELRKQLDEFDGDIEYEYDWRLNGTP